MRAFFYGVALQWKIDLRNKGILITYYLVPLLFFLFIGEIFTSMNPLAKDTLIQSMTIFAITMGAFLGTPIPLVELYSGDIKKAYQVGGIPLWTGAANNFISAFIHLFITSLIIYTAAFLAFDAKLPEYPLRYFGCLAIFIITCIAVGSLLGLFVSNVNKLTMYSQLLFLPSLMLSGIMFPTNMLPGVLEKAGYLFPATWGLKILTSSHSKLLWFLPLLLFFVGALALGAFKLSRIVKE
jgi:ABC-2 type transport system permease protein